MLLGKLVADLASGGASGCSPFKQQMLPNGIPARPAICGRQTTHGFLMVDLVTLRQTHPCNKAQTQSVESSLFHPNDARCSEWSPGIAIWSW